MRDHAPASRYQALRGTRGEVVSNRAWRDSDVVALTLRRATAATGAVRS